MNTLQYTKIMCGNDNMEFIINKDDASSLPICVVEVGHSLPKKGKRAEAVTTCFQLHYVARGTGSFRSAELSEDSAFLVMPHESQDMCVESDGFEQYWINFKVTEPISLLYGLSLPKKSEIIDLKPFPLKAAVIRSLFTDIFPKDGKDEACVRHSEGYLLGTLYQLLSLLGKKEENSFTYRNQYVQTLCSYLHAHYSEPLTLDWLSAVVGLSPKYLTRIFKSETGFTVMEYLTSIRLKSAARLLSETEKNVTEISAAAGFSDSLYFSKLFRKKFGIAPSQYRKEKRI